MALCLLAGVAGASGHKPAPAKKWVLHVRFHRSATRVQDLLADGRYVFLGGPAATDGTQRGTLIDDRTGKQTSIARPRCAFPVIGGSWLLFANCGQRLELISLSGAASRTVDRPVGAAPIAIGTQWVEFDQGCDEVHSCHTYLFTNIYTGQVRGDPTGANTIADLNYPSLARRVCSPLRVPQAASFTPPTGLLTFVGSFAIAKNARVFLERCGTRLHRLIDPNDGPVAATPRVIMWTTSELDGIFLPNLRGFTARLPTVGAYRIAAGPRTLYAVDPNDQLWTAPIPSMPRAHANPDGP
jgi:hypothetical protein